MKRENGFSLVELVMVMIVIGILAAFAMPRLGNLSSYSLSSAASDLVEAIHYAQQQSMAHSGAVHFEVALSATGFTVQRNGGGNVASPLTGGATYSEDAGVWGGVAITSATGTVTFDSRGRPTCGGGLAPLACNLPTGNNVAITLQGGGETRTVTIERFTGYARSN